MKILSGRQPWWWAILHAGKRIENRRWNTHYRGPILLHAAKGCTTPEYVEALRWMLRAHVIDTTLGVPNRTDMLRGGIVGRARIVDVVPPCAGPGGRCQCKVALSFGRSWHMPEQYGFVLADVEPLHFIPWKGSLGLLDAPAELLAQIDVPSRPLGYPELFRAMESLADGKQPMFDPESGR